MAGGMITIHTVEDYSQYWKWDEDESPRDGDDTPPSFVHAFLLWSGIVKFERIGGESHMCDMTVVAGKRMATMIHRGQIVRPLHFHSGRWLLPMPWLQRDE